MRKVNKQKTCETETQDHKHVKKNLKQKHIIRDKEQNRRARFLGRIMHTHEQACVRIIKPTYVERIMRMWKLAKKL